MQGNRDMSLTYEQMVQAVSDFEDANPAVSQHPYVHGVALEAGIKGDASDKKLTPASHQIVIYVSQPLPDPVSAFLPSAHRSNLEEVGEIEWPVEVIETPPANEEVLQGHAARQVGSRPQGTVGHNLYVQGVGHCMMSNHHVLASPTARGGTDVETRDPDAGQPTWNHTADLQAWLNNETFDYALALYRTDSDCQTAYRRCQNGTTHGYYDEFADSISIGQQHFKVGLTTRCTTGTLIGVATITVDRIRRVGQLVFTRMSMGGDSGSIVVHENSNKIVGLHFAGFDHPTNPGLSRSYSNPIYRAGFRLVGHYTFLSGGKVPIYDASNAVVPVTPEESAAVAGDVLAEDSGLEVWGDMLPGSAVDDAIAKASTQVGGKLYLGHINVSVGARGPRFPRTDPFLPVSGGSVVRVVIPIRPYHNSRGISRPGVATCLYFG